jgi:hypothetical protein
LRAGLHAEVVVELARDEQSVCSVTSNAMASAFGVRDVTFAAKGLAVDARQIARAATRLTIAHRSLAATADGVAVNANDVTANDRHVRVVVNGSSARVDGFTARARRVGPFVDDVIASGRTANDTILNGTANSGACGDGASTVAADYEGLSERDRVLLHASREHEHLQR